MRPWELWLVTAYPWSKWRWLLGIEFDLAVVVETGRYAAVRRDGLDCSEVAIGDAERPIGCGELDAVADGELGVDLSVDADTCHWRFEDRGEHHPSQKAGSRVMIFTLNYVVNILTIASRIGKEEVIYCLFISRRRKKYKQELRGGLRHGVLP